MSENKEMKFVSHPEVALLQSAVNEVIEKNANKGKPTDTVERINPDKFLDKFLEEALIYYEAAEKTLKKKAERNKTEQAEKFDKPRNQTDFRGGDILEKFKDKIENTVDFAKESVEKGFSHIEPNRFDLSPDDIEKELYSQTGLDVRSDNMKDISGVRSLSPQSNFKITKDTSSQDEARSSPIRYGLNLVVKYAQAKLSKLELKAKKYLKELKDSYEYSKFEFILQIAPTYSSYLGNYYVYGKKIPYKPWEKVNKNIGDASVIERLKANAKVAIIGDWGTGQEAAFEVLKQIKSHNPDVIIHLGDIYYSGTPDEVEKKFTTPFDNIFEFNGDFKSKDKPLILNMPGNHDMYSGGQAYYDLLEKIGIQDASYFCLRNADWQFVAMDTARHAASTVSEAIREFLSSYTRLEDTEVEWLKDKVINFEGKTILLSHHQLFSLTVKFEEDHPYKEDDNVPRNGSYNPTLKKQLEDILDKVTIWFWGHEHDMVVFKNWMNLKLACCLGASAYPIGESQIEKHIWDVPYDSNIILKVGKNKPFYQHSYAIVELAGKTAEIKFYTNDDTENSIGKISI